ncbi:MAG: glycosyltransferase [Deltaproteobacteria bacterium]|nr:glycosyltransferase [Deltaproteobacteria bacterium]MBW2032854.1 glycosyltransferase [Deltaproteobacteria bacterium]
MKILVVSNLNPHFTNTNVYRLNAIKKCGHKAMFFDDRAFFLPGRLRDRFSILNAWDMARLNSKLVHTVAEKKPDLCLFVGSFRTHRDALMEIKSLGPKIVLWTTDAPRQYDNIIKTAPIYGHVFCAGTEAIELLERHGITGARWLPFACDPDYHRPAELRHADKEILGKDIVFVGGFSQNRWEILNQLGEFSVGVWGPFWEKAATQRPKNCQVTSGHIDVSSWVKIYRAAKIVLVVHYQDGVTPCFQASPKIFEALACGCFVLVDRQKDVFRLFEDGVHLVGFDDITDLKRKIRHYLENPRERMKIGVQGQREVIEKHTYAHRLQSMFEIVSQSQRDL